MASPSSRSGASVRSDATPSPPLREPATAAARGRDLGAAALILLALLWGYNWVVMKIGLGYAQPFAFAALRTFLGALSLFLVLIVLRRSLRPRAVGFTIVIGLLQTTGFVGLLMWALQSGGAGKTSVLTYTMPFWLLLLACRSCDPGGATSEAAGFHPGTGRTGAIMGLQRAGGRKCHRSRQ